VNVPDLIADAARQKPDDMARSDEFATDRLRLVESMLVMRVLEQSAGQHHQRLSWFIVTARLVEVADTFIDMTDGTRLREFLRRVVVELPRKRPEGCRSDSATLSDAILPEKSAVPMTTHPIAGKDPLDELREALARLRALSGGLPALPDMDESLSDVFRYGPDDEQLPKQPIRRQPRRAVSILR
jgi:hypothetical protein